MRTRVLNASSLLLLCLVVKLFSIVLVPTATLLLNVSTISIVIFTAALVLFTCAMYVIVIVSAIIELKARIHYQKTMQEHREIELEKHRQELRLLSRRRIINTFRQPSLN